MAKRLLYVITQPVVGGAQKYVFDLAKNFSQGGGYDVSAAIGSPADGDLFKKLEAEQIKTHFLKSLGREVSLVGDIKAFFEMLKLFRSERPDIIHLNSSKAGLIGAVAGFFCGWGRYHKPKIIFTAHGWIFKEDLPGGKKKAAIFAEWLAAKFKDRIICVSRDDFNQALKYHIAGTRKLYTIHNSLGEGVKILSKEKAREEISKIIGRELSGDTFALANLGRLYANKGLNYLVDAVLCLKNKFPEKKIILVIFGDGPEREALQRQVTSYKLQDSVFLAGDVPDAAKYLAAFDAVVLSSIKEGFPYAILEAGAAGVPVVATNVGGIGEVIQNGVNGFLVPPKDAEALAGAVEKLIQNPDESQKMASELKKRVAKSFDFKTMASKTEWVYKV